MTTNHIDQMNAWWNEATPGIPKMGDTYIEDERHRGSSFRIVEAATDHKYGFENIRILARAPKPKPAWHDADFIVARYENDDHWQGYLRSGSLWVDSEGQKYTTGVLRDVTPLIEQKVTDAMIENAWSARDHNGQPYFTEWREASDFLTAALGIENT